MQELKKAKAISEKYASLESCHSILSSILKDDNGCLDYLGLLGDNDWRIYEHELTMAGIDKEKVYEFIRTLTISRKKEIEMELENL